MPADKLMGPYAYIEKKKNQIVPRGKKEKEKRPHEMFAAPPHGRPRSKIHVRAAIGCG